MSTTPLPTTVITTRLIRAGHEEEFAHWAAAYDAAARSSPGTLRTLRLEQPNGLVHFLHDFVSGEAIEQWNGSEQHAELKRTADCFSAERVQHVGRDRAEIRLPSEAAVPKWKTWIATWVTVFPLLLALNAVIRSVARGLPQPVQLGATSIVMTATLTWFILPAIRKRLRSWLFRDEKQGLRKEPG